MSRLNKDQWIQLDTLMRSVPDPNMTYTATGWHYQLMALLGQFGIRVSSRIHAYEKACLLLENGWND
jgi:hypothetical protein